MTLDPVEDDVAADDTGTDGDQNQGGPWSLQKMADLNGCGTAFDGSLDRDGTRRYASLQRYAFASARLAICNGCQTRHSVRLPVDYSGADSMTLPLPAAPRADFAMPRIEGRYLLLQGSTPVFVDTSGARWLDRLWAIDVREHLTYLPQLSVASPTVSIAQATPDMVSVDADPVLSSIRFVSLPHSRSRLEALRQLRATISHLREAMAGTDIVHVGIAGWPYPLGWLGLPMARRRGKRAVVVVESAPWRLGPGKHSLVKRLQARVYESVGRAIVRRCDLRFFTTQTYLDEFCGRDRVNAHVVEASWIPASQVVRPEALEARLSARGAAPLRTAFFGRLTDDKGVRVLLAAARAVGPAGLQVDIYGDGPIKGDLQSAINADPALAHVRMCGTIAYGEPLFQRLADYAYVVVPSLGDEQPRIVYDAFSQGVPVIASDTSGLRQCVQDGRTGLFFARGSSDALAGVLRQAASPEARQRHPDLARSCAAVARLKTHTAMHATRARLTSAFLKEA